MCFVGVGGRQSLWPTMTTMRRDYPTEGGENTPKRYFHAEAMLLWLAFISLSSPRITNRYILIHVCIFVYTKRKMQLIAKSAVDFRDQFARKRVCFMYSVQGMLTTFVIILVYFWVLQYTKTFLFWVMVCIWATWPRIESSKIMDNYSSILLLNFLMKFCYRFSMIILIVNIREKYKFEENFADILIIIIIYSEFGIF